MLCPLTRALSRATEQWESFDIDFNDLPNITQVHDAGEMTFIDAQLYCEKMAGWSLPIPLDQAQNDRIQNLITKSAWLGVRGIEGSWYHAYITKYVQYEMRDLFTLLYYNWAENEPAKLQPAELQTYLELRVVIFCLLIYFIRLKHTRLVSCRLQVDTNKLAQRLLGTG